MGREKTLLDRLCESESVSGRRSQSGTNSENLEALMESVRRNLARLLNSRRGMCEAASDYGLPALTDLTVGTIDYVSKIQEGIRETIENYEPRLRHVRVSMREDISTAQKLVFRVEASLVGKSGEHRVWYETAVRASGRFDVDG